MLRTCVNSVVLVHVYELSLQVCPIPSWRINNSKIAILVLDMCVYVNVFLSTLQQFHERCDVPIPSLSKLHLCRYVEVSGHT